MDLLSKSIYTYINRSCRPDLLSNPGSFLDSCSQRLRSNTYSLCSQSRRCGKLWPEFRDEGKSDGEGSENIIENRMNFLLWIDFLDNSFNDPSGWSSSSTIDSGEPIIEECMNV